MARPTKQLPCDSDGVCMVCKLKPPTTETLHCKTCVTPWHVPCLPLVPTTLLDWECPDCVPAEQNDNHVAVADVDAAAPPLAGDLVSAIRAIQSDTSLTEQEKAKKRQELVGGSVKPSTENNRSNGMLDILNGSLNCSFCMQLPERPVTVCFHFPLSL